MKYNQNNVILKILSLIENRSMNLLTTLFFGRAGTVIVNYAVAC